MSANHAGWRDSRGCGRGHGWCLLGRPRVAPTAGVRFRPIRTSTFAKERCPMTAERSHQNLRHHAARRRAIARRQHEHRRKAGNRPSAGRPGRRHHRSRLSRSPRPATSKRSAKSPTTFAARRSAAWPAATTPTSTAPGKPCKTAEQSRIHVFLATSAIHREFKLKMDKDEIIRRAIAGVQPCRQLLRRHRILARRCGPHRAGFSLRSGRSRDRGRRHDRQHSRHRRLCHAGPHRPA